MALPYSREAEEAVLGSMLLDESCIADVTELLVPEDFYVRSHQILFGTMLDLFDRGTGTDLTIVGEALLKSGELERMGGALELARLTERVPSSANVVYHSQIVLEKSLQRRLIAAANQILEQTRSGSGTIQGVVDDAERLIFEVAHRSVRTDQASFRDILAQTIHFLETRREGDLSGVPTHYRDLDERLSGLQGGQLLILAARPSMGKTTFALNVAMRVATMGEPVHGVAIFSLEMTRQQLAQHILCCFSQIDAHQLRQGSLDQENWERMGHACNDLSAAPIFIDDTPGLTMLQIRAKARRLKAMHDINLIVVDYLQLVTGPKSESRQQEISQISMGMKQLARELEVPVIALSQLNRSVEAREDHRPRMSDLRESGSLEQDADVIMFLHRDEYFDRGKNPSTKNKAQLIIAKQRNGPIGEVDLTFIPEQLRFEPYSDLDYMG